MTNLLLTPNSPLSLNTSLTISKLQNRHCDILVGTPDGDAKIPAIINSLQDTSLVVETTFDDFDLTFPLITDLTLLIDDSTHPIELDGCTVIQDTPSLDMQLMLFASDDSSDLVSTPSSALAPVLADIAWESDYSLGAGLDAQTNMVCKKGVTLNGTPKNRPTEIKTRATMISTVEEYARAFEIAVDGHYNTGTVDFKGSMSYMSDVKTSKTSLSILIEYTIEEKNYQDELEESTLSYALTSDAQAALNISPQHFRNLYGDYFFADTKKGSKFIAVYNCSTSSAYEMATFKSELGASGNLYSVATSESFESLCKTNNVTTNINFHFTGCTGTPPYDSTDDFMNISAALTWFSTNLSAVPIHAKLLHYSAIDPSVPLTLPIASKNFVDIWMMFSRLWRLVTQARNCPAPYTTEAIEKVERIRKEIVAHQSYYITQPQLITKFNNDISTNINFIKDIENKYELYKTIAKVKEVGGDKDMQAAANGRWEWSYGVTNYPNSVIEQFKCSQKHNAYFKNGEIIAKKDGYKIAGYKVTSNWKDNTGGRWYRNYGGLLQSELSIHLRSYHLRGFSWTVTIYYVLNSEIAFTK